MNCHIYQESHVGRRPSNQDRVAHWRTAQAVLLVVADGMGGHARGELAAELAVRHLGECFEREARPRVADPARFLVGAIGDAHGRLVLEAHSLGLEETPRTTVVACVVQDGYACWTHVGDSRLYLVRKGAVAARTRDHTLVQRLVDEGRMAPDRAAFHPDRNLLLRCLGSADAPCVDAPERARLERDDIVLLCTDGFWAPLQERQIVAGLESGPVALGVARLAGLARERAGPDADNLSALALAWDEAPVEEAPAGRSGLP